MWFLAVSCLAVVMEAKKISFGFSKLSKKPSLIPSKPQQPKDDKVELIDCLEGQSIKLKGAQVEGKKGPLVIPMNEPANEIVDRIKESRVKRNEGKQEVDERPDSELTLDELAARELLREAKDTEATKTATKILELPSAKDALILEGKEEPTLDDYESVPISDYGMAMLRGMGWKEGTVIGKNQSGKIQAKEPTLRPKGMGLGANKMANAEKKPKDEEELKLVKGAFAKITAGLHKGTYCQVEGFDDEAGRVIVKTSVKGEVLSLNEFLVIPISKEEYQKSSKVINNAKYEEFKSGDGRRDEPDVRDADRRVKEEPSEKSHVSRNSVKEGHSEGNRERSRKSSRSPSKKRKEQRRSKQSKREDKSYRDKSRSRERKRHTTKSKR